MSVSGRAWHCHCSAVRVVWTTGVERAGIRLLRMCLPQSARISGMYRDRTLPGHSRIAESAMIGGDAVRCNLIVTTVCIANVSNRKNIERATCADRRNCRLDATGEKAADPSRRKTVDSGIGSAPHSGKEPAFSFPLTLRGRADKVID
jgi:hypothetical protein